MNLRSAPSTATALCLAATIGVGGCTGDLTMIGSTAGVEVACNDGIDNNADGATDCEDPDCAAACARGFGAHSQAMAPPPPWPVCASVGGEAELIGGGVDIVWFVDTSGSMSEETAWVQQNLNAFATFIATQDLDYRVVMVADGKKICVPPPLGGPSCTDGERYRHVKRLVGSTNGLSSVIQSYPDYGDFLRPGATKTFVAVSDDNSFKSADWFRDELAALGGFDDGFIFHSIVAYGTEAKRGCATGARIGSVYLQLSAETGGSKFQICRTDWKPIFDELAASVAKTARPPCAYAMPAPPVGQRINPDQVQIAYLQGAQATLFSPVTDEAACGTRRGFYYDDRDSPTQATFCPAACSMMDGGKIEISFGCLQPVQ